MSTPTDIKVAPKRDLVVAFIVGHPKAGLLLRNARRNANEIGGRWRIVYIETPDEHKKTSHYQQILNLLTRAKQMGGEIEHVQALNVLQGAETLLHREAGHIYTVLIGSTEEENMFLRNLRAPMWVRLLQVASRYSKVETVPLAGQFIEPLTDRLRTRLRDIESTHLAYGVLSMGIPLAIAAVLQWVLPPAFFRINEQNIDNLFLITAAIVAGRFGLVPGILSAFVGFFINNYYFTLPYHEIKLVSHTDWFSMGLFLSGAILISIFTSRMREYTQRLKRREMYSEMLFTLYRLASESFTREQALETIQSNLETMLNAEVAFFLPSPVQHSELHAIVPQEITLDEADKRALEVCWSDMKSTGLSSPFNPGANWRFEPMTCASGEIGVLAVKPRKGTNLTAWFGRLLTAAADQTATILAHIELENSMENTRIDQEREKLRTMLLSSVSHDLKTPLAGIIGALSACQTLGKRLKPEQHNELIAGSLEEAQRLDSFITNILEMTRLETGNVTLRQNWHTVRHVTEQVTERMNHRLKKRQVSLYYPEQEVEAFMDEVLIGQVIQNLLDNACKYTHPNTPIDILWEADATGIRCHVRDYGSGIPTEKLQSVFNKYTRLQKQDRQAAGTGLGLAISKAILEAQKGWIKADNHPEGGAIFTFHLPQWRPYATALPAYIEEVSHATH